MQSSGGLTDAHLFHGKDAILSGPAGGVVGAVEVSRLAGFDRIIGFDMGGTSTDVTHYAGEYERAFVTEVAGVRLRAPMMSIHTVAAGGGSICTFDGARFRVGPESAGANPGPAAYRRGGPLTVTDCNVMVGKIDPDLFPRVFGASGERAARRRRRAREVRGARRRRERARPAGRARPRRSPTASSRIAVDNMANAIKHISVQRGYDVTEYTLCCFGGAGGQHACLVADALGMTRVFIHPLAGVLSAYGMGLADVRALRQQAVEAQLSAAGARRRRARRSTRSKTTPRARSPAQGIERGADRVPPLAASQVRGHRHDACASPPADDAAAIVARVRGALRDAVRLPDARPRAGDRGGRGRGRRPRRSRPPTRRRRSRRAPVRSRRSASTASTPTARTATRRCTTAITCVPGDAIAGPAIVRERNATTVIEPGWRATLTPRDHLVLERVDEARRAHAIGTTADPVLLEVFNNLFMAIAEQMGVTLANTAYSVNIKERLDFSCALFDADGNLIANAPHMPVHLGSMGESVKTIIDRRAGTMQRGDVFVLNAPYNGGTHLPDVTVIAPVFLDGSDGPEFYVASRGHHADIGGITPGSMPPDSTYVEQEGVLLDNVQLVAEGRFLDAEMRAILSGGPYPSRNVDQNLADLRAQVAACAKGASELARMVGHFGLPVVRAYMQHVQDNAEESVRRVLGVLKDGSFAYRDGQRRDDSRRHPHRPREARGDDRLHRHQRAAADQLQRAVGGVQGRGAVRLPHARRRRDPDERRLPEAAAHRDPGRLDAEPALSRRGRRRQRRDVAGGHRHALRRARRARRVAGHDEQLHVRQRHAPVLRDDRRRRRAPARTSTARASCRRT